MLDAAIAWIEANADLLGGIGTICAATMFLVTNGRNMMRNRAVSSNAISVGTEAGFMDAPPPSPEYGGRTAIAVLPFKELGSLPEHFTDGLMDDLTADLQKLGFASPTHTSVTKLVTSGADTQTVARQLSASYCLEGSIRCQDNKYRIAAQLVSSTGAVVWSDRLNMTGDDIMAMQESAARQIADGINTQLEAKAAESVAGALGAAPYRTQSEALSAGTSPKSRLVALILCFLVGVFGVHRFYIGRWATGILYFFTAGLFAIGWLLDTILLLFGALTDKHNRRIRRWLPADPHAPSEGRK